MTEPSPAQCNALIALFNEKRYSELETLAYSLTEHYPNSGFAWKILGATLRAQGKDARSAMQKVTRILPEDVEAHINLGNMLRDCKQLNEAVTSFRHALKIKHNYAEAHNNLGATLKDLGQLDNAAASYRNALKIKPDFIEAHYNLGNVLQELKQFERAATSYRCVLKKKPDFAEAHFQLGNVLQNLNQLDDTVTHYRHALELKPDYAEAYCNLGNAYRRMSQIDNAIANYCQALKIKPDFAEAHYNLGATLRDLRQFENAVASYRLALKIKPDHIEALTHLGSVLMELGKNDEAEKVLNKAIELAPGEVEPLTTALLFISYPQNDPRFIQLETLYAKRTSFSHEEQIRLNFAMGKAMENIGQYDRSFNAYQEGNQLHLQNHPFDDVKEALLFEKIGQLFTNDLFNKFAAEAKTLPDIQNDRNPIFIVGMPRSGTTLIEQILASHPALFGSGELTTLGEVAKKAELLILNSTDQKNTLIALRQLGHDYLEQVWQQAPEARYITDKMPSNYLYLGLIHLMLPHAKIIHTQRDPLDTCFSCYALRFTFEHEYSYDLKMLGKHFLRYQKLMEHWHNVLPPGSILDINYENNIANPEQEGKRLLNYLELPWDAACLKFHETERTISTASVTQVRKPLYSTSIARWKRFKKHLHPLLEIITFE